MNYLFIHQNFPAQYRHIARHLASRKGNQVYFITQPNDNAMQGVNKITYPRDSRGHVNCHAYSLEIDRAIYAVYPIGTTLLAVMTLWLGLMRLAEKAGWPSGPPTTGAATQSENPNRRGGMTGNL